MANVHTVYAENQNSVQFQFGTNDRITIPISELTTGDRYLIIWKGIFGPNNGLGRYQLIVDGVSPTSQRGEVACSASNGRMKEISGIHLITAPASGDIVLQAQAVSGTFGTRWGSEQVLLINLDDALISGVDWLFDSNDVQDQGGTSFGSESEPATLTFTPDGVSDYLVLSSLQFQLSALDDGAWAVRDITNALDLVQCGQGGGNIGAEQVNNLRMHVLSAPAAVPLTLETGYKNIVGIDKTAARLFVLRLNAFASYASSQADLNQTPTSVRESLTPTVQVTPSANQEVILLGSFMGELAPSFGSGLGYRCDIEYDGSVESNTQGTILGSYTNVSDNTFPKADTWGGDNLITKLTGQAQSATNVQGFGKSFNSTPAQHTWRTQTLVAFATEFFNETPPQVLDEIPVRDSLDQSRTTDVLFTLGKGGLVVLSSVQVAVRIGSGSFENAVVNGVVQFPFDGPNSAVTFDSDDLDIVLDYRGAFPAGVRVEVRVDANSGGDAMPQTTYDFLCTRDALSGISLLQIER